MIELSGDRRCKEYASYLGKKIAEKAFVHKRNCDPEYFLELGEVPVHIGFYGASASFPVEEVKKLFSAQ